MCHKRISEDDELNYLEAEVQNELFLRMQFERFNFMNRIPHDTVYLTNVSPDEFKQTSSKLYSEGYSLNAIAKELKVSKSTVRFYLLEAGVELRSHSKRKKCEALLSTLMIPVAPRNAPYGFFLQNGRILEDSKEQSIIQIITDLHRKGLSQGAIARHLNNLGIKPRKAAEWKQVTIGVILKRVISKGGGTNIW